MSNVYNVHRSNVRNAYYVYEPHELVSHIRGLLREGRIKEAGWVRELLDEDLDDSFVLANKKRAERRTS